MSVFVDFLKLIVALYIVFGALYVTIRSDTPMLPKDELGRPIYPKKPTREQVAAARAARPWDPERDKRELKAKNTAPWGEFGISLVYYLLQYRFFVVDEVLGVFGLSLLLSMLSCVPHSR